MKLNSITQCTPDVNPVEGVDLIIGCCGYEMRCTSLLQHYGDIVKSVKHKKGIVFSAPTCEETQQNRSKFTESGFDLIEVATNDDYNHRMRIIERMFECINTENSLTVLIDYTSMNREWYSTILLYLDLYSNNYTRNLECRFYYREPKHIDKKDEYFSFSCIHPIEGFAQFSIPDKPLALIIGLGSEERALNGILQFADVDREYVHYYYTNNKHVFNEASSYTDIFDKISESNKHEYKLDKMIPLFNSLCDLNNLLSETNRVVIISCGPKPFTLISLVFAKLYNVDVWKLDTNISDHIVEKEASDDFVLLTFRYN